MTSGTQSPCLEKGIGIGYVDREKAIVGNIINVSIRNNRFLLQLPHFPFIMHHETGLIFGGSGFLGSALFKELHPYMDIVWHLLQLVFVNNKRYYRYDFREDSPLKILKKSSQTLSFHAFEAMLKSSLLRMI